MGIALFMKFSIKSIPKQYFFNSIHFFSFVIVPSIFSFTILFLGSFYKNMNVYGSQYTELPINMAFINSIVFGSNKERDSILSFKDPLISGRNLLFISLPDILSANLIKAFDISLHSSLVLPSIPFIFASFYLLSLLFFIFTNNNFTATTFAFLSFFFLGGRGYVKLFDEKALKSQTTDFIQEWGKNNFQFCLHPVMQMLIPQRSTLFSFPLCLGVLLVFIIFEFGKKQKTSIYIFCSIVLLTLPLIQIQAFIGMIEWIIIYMIISLIKERNGKIGNIITNWFIFFSITICGVFLEFKNTIHEIISDFHFVQIFKEFGYSSNLSMYYNCYHFFFIYSFLHGVIALDSKQRVLYLPAIFVFLMSNLFLYQYYPYENIKSLLVGWIPFACATIGTFLAKIWEKTTKRAILFFVFLVLPLWTTGVIFLCSTITSIGPLYSMPDAAIQLAQWTKENTNYNSIWLVEGKTISPIVSLAGRQAVVGSQNFIETRKIQCETSRTIALSMLQNDMDSTELADSYDVQFIWSGNFQNDPKKYDLTKTSKWDLVFNISNYVVYRRKNYS